MSTKIEKIFDSVSFADLDKYILKDKTWTQLSFLCLTVLWLYLFLSFKLFGFPIFIGQIEEWTCSAVLLSLIGCFLFYSIFRKKNIFLHISVCDILIFFYLVYILFRLGDYLYRQEYILCVYTLTLLYVIVRVMNANHLHYIIPVFVIALGYQVFDAFFRHDYTWKFFPEITGIFRNSGIMGCFAGIVTVGIYGLFLFSRRKKVFMSIQLLFSSIIMIYSQSRTAWIGAFAGIVFLSFIYLWKNYGSKVIRLAIITILAFIPIITFAIKRLYLLKPVSADGRFYIWKISSRMIEENPWIGIGIDKFKSKYMYYQAEYLLQNPNSPFLQIADETNEPFSEPLKIAIEQGVVGLAFVLAIIFTSLIPILKKKNLQLWGDQDNDKGCTYYVYAAILITLFMFSYFSYPLIYIQFCFLLITCIAILSRTQKGINQKFRCNKKICLLMFISYTLTACYVSFNGMSYLAKISKFHYHYCQFDINNPEEAVSAYAGLEPDLKSNPAFMLTYANFLFFNKEYERAIEKYTKSLSYKPSYNTYIELGRNYEKSGDTNRALGCWKQASSMIPNRFEPLYLQISIYHRNGLYHHADSLTTLILQKKRKVDTIRIDRMLKNVREWAKERLDNSDFKNINN